MSNKIVKCGKLNISNSNPFVLIAGPCQLETEKHAIEVASELKKMTEKLNLGVIYKTSFDKANRTSLKGKRGAGLEKSLPVFNKIKKELGSVRRTRSLHRRARKRYPFPIVALVGYTNSGKSTLFNYLTGADVKAEDQLFATLDPTMRRGELPSGGAIILSDTVGFISDLPHELVEAFNATLEEVLEADILVHVQDLIQNLCRVTQRFPVA